MKKRILVVVIIMLCVVMLFSACNFGNVENPDNSNEEATYTVTFLNYDNSLLYRATDIKEGEPAIYGGDLPTRPDTYEYTYSFIGWDKDISAIYSNLAVFAKYSETRKTEDGDPNTDKDAQTGSNGVVLSASILSDSLYLYQPNTKVTEDSPYDLLYSCRDNDNYYYGFDLGTVKNVIVDDNSYSIRYMGPANIKRTYTTSKVSSTSIENQSSWLEQRLEYDDNIAGWSAGLEVGVKDVFSVKASASVQYYSNTTTTTNSSGETVKQEVTVTESQSIEMTFDSTCPYGEYRISHVMDYDVFIIATKAITTGEITLNLMTLPRKGIIELYEYSDNGFTDIQLPELDFDSSIINTLPIPTDYIESGDEIPPSRTASIVAEVPRFYVSSDSFTIFSVVNNYGLLNVNYETIDLSNYRNYFNNNYMFCFTVTLNLSNNNSNYQEIFLYSNNKTTSDAVEISTAISSYGLVRGSTMKHGSGAYNHYITWNVRGDEIKDNMYIRYDASGNNFLFNTWTKNSISVGLTIVSESKDLPSEKTILNNSNRITVTDDGIYGLAARSHEQILLSDYSEYMTSDYIFIFDVTINMNEKDDGYQEVYLYNKYDVTTTSTSKDISYAREHGLVYGTQIEHDPGKANTKPQDHNFNWVITGNNICDTMYIRYDAHGKDDDTWYKNSIKITLKIFYAPDFEVDSSVSDVFT
ncbi:MAG: hypothetical protein J1G07_05420 [Clostridiales bacterium]|nr:hypothetical protein [Clostridiales bacterium]